MFVIANMNINRLFKEVSKDTPTILALFTVMCCERRAFIFLHVLPLQVSPSFLSSLLAVQFCTFRFVYLSVFAFLTF